MIKYLLKVHYSLKLPAAVIVMIALLLAGFPGIAQQITVSGVVKDAEAPLPGVSILEKGTSKGTTTDADGKFTLAVTSESSVLVFSFIGYKTQEVAVNGEQSSTLSWKKTSRRCRKSLSQRWAFKKKLSRWDTAVQKVEGESVTKAREPNIMNSLTGKVAGLTGAKSNGSLSESCDFIPRSNTINRHRWRPKCRQGHLENQCR